MLLFVVEGWVEL